ncbi:MAG: S1 RNA-binding domain-containing protein, partial [Chloroflexota bacterium]
MDRRADPEQRTGVDPAWNRRAINAERPEEPTRLPAPPAAGEAAGESGTGEGSPVLDSRGYPPDDEALRGTRFEFGGRRPFSFAPPRVTYRTPQRPLPGIGTVALGRVTRTAPYGAFVDFLGYRGLVHISQLLPGYRVERVEDVVQVGNEVVVRVIAVDPERRHINLALVPSATRAAVPVPNVPAAEAPAASDRAAASAATPASPSTTATPRVVTSWHEARHEEQAAPASQPPPAPTAAPAPAAPAAASPAASPPAPPAPAPTPSPAAGTG